MKHPLLGCRSRVCLHSLREPRRNFFGRDSPLATVRGPSLPRWSVLRTKKYCSRSNTSGDTDPYQELLGPA